jgi:hypothetical protein
MAIYLLIIFSFLMLVFYVTCLAKTYMDYLVDANVLLFLLKLISIEILGFGILYILIDLTEKVTFGYK